MNKTSNSQTWKVNILFAIIVILLLVSTLLFNAIMLVLSNRYSLSVDLTANAVFEIGNETKQVLSDLDEVITIDVLATKKAFTQDSYLVQVGRILEQYPQNSKQISLRYIDYAMDPSYAAEHADLSLSEGDIIVSAKNGRVKQLNMTSLFNYAYASSDSLTIESSRAEEAVTGAILYVTDDRTVRIGVLIGNGQQESSNFIALLANNNYELERVVTSTEELSSYDALLLLAPQVDFSEDDIRKLDDYLYNGGNYGKMLFYAASVTQTVLPNLETFLSEWGVAVGDGAVFETKEERTYQYQPYYPITEYTSEKWKEMLIDTNTPILMPLCRPIEALFDARDSQYTEILLSFGKSAGVRPSDAGEDFKPENAQQRGPIPAMILAGRRVYENGVIAKSSSIAVTGSVSMLEELCIQNASLANSSYLLNLFSNLTERGDNISIMPKSLSGKTLGITTSQVSALGVVLGGVIPLCILLTGVAVWLYRRYR